MNNLTAANPFVRIAAIILAISLVGILASCGEDEAEDEDEDEYWDIEDEGDYYVSPDGDDANPGTEELPWRTIQRAASSLGAGRYWAQPHPEVQYPVSPLHFSA